MRVTENNICEDINSLTVNGYTFALKQCKEIVGHDDSAPYVAILHINGKKVCGLFNDGWGGETNMTQIADSELIEEANKAVNGQPWPRYPWESDSDLPPITIHDIRDIADTIAETVIWLNYATKKYGKKLTIIAVRGNKMLSANIAVVNDKTIAASINKCNELANKGWYILNAPQMYCK